ncbi:hypothetical protein PNU51_13840 [Turicibacter sanguinis]|uniref:hypothetical protein n=1 Tax=Turicibacter sanguinis TaxID=154288 RepID=UPI00232F5A20|nr:hypothetical protein [Turicibacter sanguinis]MDB8562369.1 hypothetical protein [Turicibacter sanguinis]
MNKLKSIILLIVLDLMIFYTSLNIQYNNYNLIVTGICIVIMLILSKKLINILSDKFNLYYNENKTNLNIIKEQHEENHKLVIEKINGLRLENENVIKDIIYTHKILSGKLYTLIEAENNLLSELKEHNLNSSKMLLDYLNNLNKEIVMYQQVNIENIKEVQSTLLELSKDTSSNISNIKLILNEFISNTNTNLNEIAILFDDTIKAIEKSIVEQNDKNHSLLNRSLDKNLKDLNKKIVEGHSNSINLLNDISGNNLNTLKDIQNIINQLSKLHKDLLKEIDNNQKKMMELNEEDIMLMREMIK